MPTEFLYATSHIAGDFTNPNNAVGNTPGTWAGVVNENTSQTSRWAIGDPSEALTGTQTIRVSARKGSNSGIPTLQINLYENGSLVSSGATVNVTSDIGQIISRTFDASVITSPANVEIEVVVAAAGGSPTARNAAQVAYLEWEASIVTVGPPTEAPVISSPSKTHNSISLSWTTVSGAATYELQRDTVTIQNTSAITRDDTGLTPVTQYSYRVRAVNAQGDGPWSNVLLVTTDEEPPPPPPAVRANSFEGGVSTEAITTLNSGGDSGDAFDLVWGTTHYTDVRAAHGTISAIHTQSGGFAWDFSSDTEPIMYARVYLYHDVTDVGNIVFEKIFTFFDDNLGAHEFTLSWLAVNGQGVVITLPSSEDMSVVIPPFQWVRVEAVVNMTDGTYEARLFLDPDSETVSGTVTGSFFSSGSIVNEIWFAELSAMIGKMWSDDVAVSNQGWIGPVSGGGPATRQVTSSGVSGHSNAARIGFGARVNSSEGATGSSTAHTQVTGFRFATSQGVGGHSEAGRIGSGQRQAGSDSQTGSSAVSRVGFGTRAITSNGQAGSSSANAALTPGVRSVASQGSLGESSATRVAIGDRLSISSGVSGNTEAHRTGFGQRSATSDGQSGHSTANAALTPGARGIISTGEGGASSAIRQGTGHREAVSIGSPGSSSVYTSASVVIQVTSSGVGGHSGADRIGLGNRETASEGVGGISSASVQGGATARSVTSTGQDGNSTSDRIGNGSRAIVSSGGQGHSASYRIGAGNRVITTTGLIGFSTASTSALASRSVTSSGLPGHSEADRIALGNREANSVGSVGHSGILRIGFGSRFALSLGMMGHSIAISQDSSKFGRPVIGGDIRPVDGLSSVNTLTGLAGVKTLDRPTKIVRLKP